MSTDTYLTEPAEKLGEHNIGALPTGSAVRGQRVKVCTFVNRKAS